MKICLYAIAKNEECEVDEWYQSVKDADEIVVLDTGSTDNTMSKLQSLGVRVYQKNYAQFRFDVARNDALAFAKQTDCDIFITIDLDERLSDGWYDALQSKWIKGKHTRATYGYAYQDYNTQAMRNWAHDISWSWMYPCHEVLKRNNNNIWYTFDEELDLTKDIMVRHYPKPMKSTRSQYLPLLEMRLKENPNDCCSLAYYIRELTYSSQWDKIIEIYHKMQRQDYQGAEWAWCLVWIAVAYESVGDIDKAIYLLHQSLSQDKRFRTTYINLARLYVICGQYCIAEGILKQGLKNTSWDIRSLFLDANDIWNWRYYDWLYVVCFNQNKTEEAFKWISLALIDNPDHELLQAHYKSCIELLNKGR